MGIDVANTAAAGILFRTADGRVLLCRRVDDGHHWSVPGGGIEEGETPEVAARREAQEETGFAYAGELTRLTRRIADGVDFTTYTAEVPEFEPTLNAEHDIWRWVAPEQALAEGGLHPGLVISLLRPDMDELDISKAIMMGELASPEHFGNVLLIALRITGTGASFRSKLDEYVWRDPSLYLNDRFVERCQGLPVIVEHPPTDMLNPTEYRDRVVGAITLPYIEGDEVWGIAKIYDDVIAKLLETAPLSTSPAVVFKPSEEGVREPTPDGKHLLIEGMPSLLDHLAICVQGVWDKGGPPAGVRNQSTTGEPAMADQKADDKPRKDDDTRKDGDGPLDKVLHHLEGLHGAIDALGGRMDAAEKRMDSFGKKDDDDDAKKDDDAKRDKDDPREGDPVQKQDPDPKKDDDDSKKDDDDDAKGKKDDDAKKDDDQNEGEKRGDAMVTKKTVQDMLDARLREPTAEERQKFVAAQGVAEPVYQAFGDSHGAPRFLNGETLLGYRKRLLAPHLVHSKAWKGANVEAIADEAVFANIERQVYADAMAAAMRPTVDQPLTLRRVVRHDDAGRKITEFYGDPEACWGQFKSGRKAVIGFNTTGEQRR